MAGGRYIVAPEILGRSDRYINTLSWLVRDLKARQNLDGSWGATNAILDDFISTCHCLMFFVSLGFNQDDPFIMRAINWLRSKGVAKQNTSYWALAPLAPFYGKEDPVIKEQLGKLEQAILGHSQPHPDQYVQGYYLRIAKILGHESRPDIISTCIKDIVETWSDVDGWASRLDSSLNCYTALCAVGHPLANEIRPTVLKLVVQFAKQEKTGISWGKEISTAYCIMNLVESDLIEIPEVFDLVNKAAAWLLSRRRRGGLWKSEMPYGGDGDIVSLDYPSAAIGRGLVAFCSNIYAGRIDAAVMKHLWRFSTSKRKRATFATLILFPAFLLVSFTPIEDSLPTRLNDVRALDVMAWGLEEWGFVIGVVGLVIAFLQIFVPDLRAAIKGLMGKLT